MQESKAAVIREPSGSFEIENVEIESPRSGEVLVRVVGVGICHTDLAARDQHLPVSLPVVLGHEGSGIVEEVGDGVDKVEPGDHVVMSFDYDDSCPNCQAGQVAYCENWEAHNFATERLTDGSSPLEDADGERVNGLFFGQSSFATHALATERNVIPVDDDVPLDLLGPLGCGVQTGAGGVFNTLDPEADSSIAVFGAGSVGLSAVMAADVVGCSDIVAIDLKDARLETARELGATHTINPSDVEDVVEAIRDHLGGGVQYSLENTGQSHVLRQAFDILRPTGVCGVIGAPPLGTEASLDVNELLSGRTVTGITMGGSDPNTFIPQLIDLYRNGEFPFDELVTFYDFEELNEAIEDQENGDAIKPVLKMTDE